MLSKRRAMLSFSLVLLCVAFLYGCVTRTERIYPYKRIPKEESVWEELRREFGWQRQDANYKEMRPTEPFYKRAMQGVTATVSEWFSEENDRLSDQEIAENRRRFNRKREEALQRLREQQERDQILETE